MNLKSQLLSRMINKHAQCIFDQLDLKMSACFEKKNMFKKDSTETQV